MGEGVGVLVGAIPLYGLYRYVLLDRIWFFEVLGP